jgi:hypothetical protein
MVGVGNIVSVGGAGGTGGGGSTSGILSINGQTGDEITLVGVSGIEIVSFVADQITIGYTIPLSGVVGVNGAEITQIGGNFVVDVSAVSGLIEPSGGIGSINGQIGPTLEVNGANGVNVAVTAENTITIDAAALSGVIGNDCYVESFSNITNTTINHNLGTVDVIIDVFDASSNKVLADRVGIIDINNVILEFNRPQTGKVVIVSCGGENSNMEECRRYALLVS